MLLSNLLIERVNKYLFNALIYKYEKNCAHIRNKINFKVIRILSNNNYSDQEKNFFGNHVMVTMD